MATLIETRAAVDVRLSLDAQGGKHAWVSATTFDAQGNALRTLDLVEVTGDLTPAQVTAGVTLLNAATAWVLAHFGIA